MIRYRIVLFIAALSAGLAFGNTWYAAGHAAGITPNSDRLAVPLDDAAIYFQYGRQALHGEWLRYNPGAPLSTGVTSPLYFLLITAGLGLGLGGPAWAWILGLGALLLGLVCADRVSRRLFPAVPAWWTGLLLLSQGSWVAAHFNAMETGLQLGLTWLFLDALTEDLLPAPFSGESALPSPAKLWLAMAALAFTRPEGQVLALVFGAAWAFPKPWRLAGVGALAAAPTLLLLLISGSVVPDSVRPKSAALFDAAGPLAHASAASEYAVGVIKGAWMGFWGGADAVGKVGDAAAHNPIGPQFPPLALLASLFGLLHLAGGRRKGLGWSALVGLACLLALLSWNLPVGWHDHRYLACATPLLYLGMLAALQALRAEGGSLGKSLAAAGFGLWIAFGLASWPWHLQRCYDGAFNYAKANTNAALALRGMPPGAVAVIDSGLLAYYSGRPIVDLPGITDHALAMDAPQGWGAVLRTLIRRPPVIAVLHDERQDYDLGIWAKLGLLQRIGPISDGMSLYRWDWGSMDLEASPARLPHGLAVVGGLAVADLAEERSQGVAYSGSAAKRTLLTRLRLAPRGPQVAEGGRKVSGLTLPALPTEARFLLLRGAFDHAGHLLVQGSDGAIAVEVRPNPAEVYSEILAPLGLGKGPVTLSFVTQGASGQDPTPRDFAVYRIWYLK